jgi:RND superfamily putative drug exporter
VRALAKFCYERRRYVVAGWIVFLVGLFVLNRLFAGEFKTEFELPGSESQAAIDLLKEKGANERTGFQGQVVFKADQGVSDPEVRGAIEKLLTDIETGVPEVDVASPYEPGNEYEISADDNVAYAELNFADRNIEDYSDDADVIKGLRDDVNVQGLQIELGGDMLFGEARSQRVHRHHRRRHHPAHRVRLAPRDGPAKYYRPLHRFRRSNHRFRDPRHVCAGFTADGV